MKCLLFAMASLAIAAPVNAQMSLSEEKLGEVYGMLGSDMGFLICRNVKNGSPTMEDAFQRTYRLMTAGDQELLENVLNMPEGSYYRKLFEANVEFQIKTQCEELVEKLSR